MNSHVRTLTAAAVLFLAFASGCGPSNGTSTDTSNGNGSGDDSPGTASVAGTYTGSITSVLMEGGESSSPDTVSVSWTFTQSGDTVLFGIPNCAAAAGSMSGSVISVEDVTCPSTNGIVVEYTGGTITIDGDTAVVDLQLHASGDGASATGSETGTLTKS